MKKIFKVVIIMILSMAMCIPMQVIVKASTFASVDSKRDVVVSKSWTVSFNKSLSASTVNTTNVKVVGENNNNVAVNVNLASDNKSVIVKPVKNYEYNKKYTLVVTSNVKCYDGSTLPKEVRMDFTTENESTKPSNFTVCIDPAQYYKSIIGANGAKAKDINLSTALKLGEILKSRGVNVVYTRDSDTVSWNINNEDEVKATIAKNANANVFLSINTNSYSSNTAKGIETYYLSDSSNNNKVLATLVQSEIIKATGAYDRGIKQASESANFEILRKTACPTVMVELGFISNLAEELLLSSGNYQYNSAKAIANGLMTYAGFPNTDTSYDSLLKVTSVQDIMVNLQVGNTYVFPQTVQAVMSNDSKENVAVQWDENSVCLDKLGTYTYEGTIKDYDKKVKLVINVVKNTYKVVLDPGHGGNDPGAIGTMGTKEKAVVLQIALKTGDILVKNGVETIYTRETDITQSLQEKCDISNSVAPNYFVSIHANSYTTPTVSGIETFYYSGNAAGQKLATAVQTELIKETGRVNRGVKTAGFYVLNNTDATSILVETSFLSNPQEEKLLVTEDYQNKLAKAIATGILKSLGITNIVY